MASISDEVIDPIEGITLGDVDYFKVVKSKDILQARARGGITVLSLAVVSQQLECFKVILQRCPELLYVQDDKGYTVLHYAAVTSTEYVQLVVGTMAEKRLLTMTNGAGDSPLQLAILYGNFDAMKILIEADSDLESTPERMVVLYAWIKDNTETPVQTIDLISKYLAEKTERRKNLTEEPIDRVENGAADFLREIQAKTLLINSEDKGVGFASCCCCIL